MTVRMGGSTRSSREPRAVSVPRDDNATPDPCASYAADGRDRMASPVEQAAMRRALELAASVPGRVSPNPRVGCVLLDATGTGIAEGAHRGAGTVHAEVDALGAAGAAARGATAVVTLEPCSHTGRTGACTDALIAAGVARVVFAMTDPDPVAAGGADVLRNSGIGVEGGVLAADAAALNCRWAFSIERARPFVTWKVAATLDGRSAAVDGTSTWITGPDARHDVHRLRAQADAIVVGTGTVLADDPRLNVRDRMDAPLPFRHQPLRVVVGTRDLPDTARVWDDAADTVQIRTHDVRAVLQALSDLGVRHAWLEGGPRLAGAFVAAGLVDEVVAYLAPALLGDGRAALAAAGVETLAGRHRLAFTDVTRLGADVRLTARPLTAEVG